MDKQEKAIHAKALQGNPLFSCMREDIEKDLIREWKDSSLIESLSLVDQAILRERIWHRVQALEHIDQRLRKYIQEGYVRKAKEPEATKPEQEYYEGISRQRVPMEVV